MKKAKKILAALFVVMMIAMMIPFSANAAETYTYSITGVPEGYTVTVYKVADIDPVTMEYSNGASAKINSLLMTMKEDGTGIDSVKLLAACDELSDTALNALTKSTELSKTVNAGVYYAKVTGVPSGVSVKKAESSVFALPYYEDGARNTTISFGVGQKIEDSTPTVTNYFTDNTSASSITEFIGTDINYTLKGAVVGQYEPAKLQATAYKFVDTMCNGLDYKNGSVKVYTNTTTKADIGTGNYSVDYNEATHVLTVTLTEAYLKTSEFYSSDYIYVDYKAALNSNAVKGIKSATTGDTDDNYNTVTLEYTAAGKASSLTGPYLEVYTFDIPVIKVDGNTGDALESAKFTVYSDADCTTVAANGAEKATSGNGYATFEGFKADTYYVKETAAPDNYNLNNTVYTVVISNTGAITVNGVAASEVEVPDYPIIAPQTGGAGTVIFTIVGLSLIACAGVLFLVVRKRNATK